MSGRDWRTVGELLVDSDGLARETLLDVSPDGGPAMLRTFTQVVQSAARLSSVLPPATLAPASEPDVMVRLQAVGRGIGRSVSVSRWPGPGRTDERMAEMADNLSRAAVLVERNGRDVQPTTPEVRADIQAARSRVLHAVYVAAHGTTVALTGYVQDLQDRLEAATRRHTPVSERPNPKDISAAQAMLSRLDVFEQLAATYVASHPVTLASLGEVTAPTPGSRLEAVLARWDIQAHRTLAAQPDPADLVRVARTQALVVAAAVVVSLAAGEREKVDSGVVQRLAPTLEAAQVAWTLTANVWSAVRSTNGHADPALIRAASDVRTAIAATAFTRNGWANPEQLADRLDLAKTLRVLQLGIVASVDVAFLMREVAAVAQGLTAQARVTDSRALENGERAVDPGAPPVQGPARAISQAGPNPSTPFVESVRRGLVNLADDVIATTNRAVATATPLEHGRTNQLGQLPRHKNSCRGAGEPDVAIRSAPEGPRR